ncbi:Serine/threonine protein kinase [Parafrankia sp. Ea1.12]|uniref:serine/threonine-protein kinase n=1 Tax=Parafrankia sp. Ea1.12 TaxID=573499 RepID=UPI000DA567D6|nr:serine/threonine-protein kinase [Parafrankia sp. Ea1.12]SQD98129.1 Serine/threonine protein kinase [Parafrankia sp. Ea1.12]
MADTASPAGIADTAAAGPAGEPDGKRRFGGRYRVDGELGRGGMSQVFYGYDERLDRPVAIKVLRQSPAGQIPTSPDSPENIEILDQLERDRKRFLREIRTTAQLEHPGIPAVYDTGSEKNPDGSPRLWLVMQLLRGSSLEALIDGTDYETEPLALARAAAVAAQIAAVLADVHRVDIVHRDIKPANIMVVDGGLVKVLDFGIAILRGAGALPRLTQIDKTVGTPPYMSPEQHLGQVVTTASDIYSLGCLLFELLTGDRPFYDRPDNSLRAQHVQTAAPPVRAHRSGIPPELGSLVAAMLAKEPRERPTAEAVYNVLVPLVAGPSSAGVPDSPSGQDGRVHPADEPAGDGRDPTRPFRHPLLAPPRRRIPAARRPQLSDAAVDQLRANIRVLLDNDRPAEAISLLEDGVERGAEDPARALELRELLAATLFFADEYSRAASLFDAVGHEYRRWGLEPSHPWVLNCAYHAGIGYAQVGKPDEALPQLRFYVQHADPTAGDDEPDRIRDARVTIAQLLAGTGHRAEALAELEGVRRMLLATFGGDSTQVRNLTKLIDRIAMIR